MNSLKMSWPQTVLTQTKTDSGQQHQLNQQLGKNYWSDRFRSNTIVGCEAVRDVRGGRGGKAAGRKSNKKGAASHQTNLCTRT